MELDILGANWKVESNGLKSFECDEYLIPFYHIGKWNMIYPNPTRMGN